jgi:choice-of-anchor B domain-containing protein
MRLPVALIACLSVVSVALAHPDDPKIRDHQPPYPGPGFLSGAAGPRGPSPFAAKGVTLGSWISLADFASFAGVTVNNGNSCWGYISPSGREYAIMGLSSGTAFVEITDPNNAQIVAHITGPSSLWRDVKTHGTYCYAISEGGGGIQIINLSNIDGVSNRVVAVNFPSTPDGSMPTTATHTLAVNNETGRLYRTGGGQNGLRIYGLSNPESPNLLGSWTDRYVHEAQVVTYHGGPYDGREIAFCCSGYNTGNVQTGLDILDVTDPENIINLYPPRVFWPQAAYSHQIWLSEDRRYAYLNDELDEQNFGNPTITEIIDVSFLLGGPGTIPFVAGNFTNNNSAIGHNLYTKDGLIFESNYRSGLRLFCYEDDPLSPVEIGFFDTYPDDDGPSFNGDWNNWPYFPSGTVILSDIERGLFVLDVSTAKLSLNFAYPIPRPQVVAPNGTTTIRASVGPVACGNASVQSESVTLHYDVGGGFVSVPMTDIGGGEFEAAIGASSCGQIISYYITAENHLATTFSDPHNAPTTTYTAVSTYGDVTVSYDNFQSNTGWTASVSGATAGQWQRGIPVNDPNWAYDPATDGDGSGQCYLTQNGFGNTDVDNGSVLLTSPNVDMTAGIPRLSYYYFINMTTVTAGDGLFVQVSSNGLLGPWTQVRAYTTSSGLTWKSDQIEASQLTGLGVALTSTMRVRFTAADLGTGGIVEAAVDGFRLARLQCLAPCAGADGDVNADGFVDGRDVARFVAGLFGPIDPTEVCHGDFNLNASLDDADTPGFVGALLSP